MFFTIRLTCLLQNVSQLVFHTGDSHPVASCSFPLLTNARRGKVSAEELFFPPFFCGSFTPCLPPSVCYFSTCLSVAVCLRTQFSSWSHLCLRDEWEGENETSEQNVSLRFDGVGSHQFRCLKVDMLYILAYKLAYHMLCILLLKKCLT